MRLCSAWHPDQFRKHRAGETPALLSIDFQTVWEEEWQAHLLNAALNRVKPEHEMYYLHVVTEQPAHEVARTLGVSTVQIYLAKHRVGAALRRELKQLSGNLW